MRPCGFAGSNCKCSAVPYGNVFGFAVRSVFTAVGVITQINRVCNTVAACGFCQLDFVIFQLQNIVGIFDADFCHVVVGKSNSRSRSGNNPAVGQVFNCQKYGVGDGRCDFQKFIRRFTRQINIVVYFYIGIAANLQRRAVSLTAAVVNGAALGIIARYRVACDGAAFDDGGAVGRIINGAAAG